MQSTENQSLNESEDNILERAHTQGAKKIWLYFLEIRKSEHYQKKLKSIREKYNVKARVNDEPLVKSKKSARKLTEEVNDLCNYYDLSIPDWQEYIFQDLEHGRLTGLYDITNDLCELHDLVDDLSNGYLNEGWKSAMSGRQREDLKNFPIAIFISPYASQNDIVEYVKQLSPIIKHLQKKYKNPKNKIGKFKSKRVAERDKFIYENRNKSGKELARLVKERFNENLTYEYVLKIKSREAKKRQKL